MAASCYLMSDVDELKSLYLKKSIADVPTPAAVVDIAKVRKSCQLMLDATGELGLSFRAHVKAHKTIEIARLQVGEKSKDVRFVVSTVMEAEQLMSLLQEYKAEGAKVNVLYGVPVGPSTVSRLAKVGKSLGPGSIALMVDDVAQVASLEAFKAVAGFPAAVFIKADSGSHRAGLLPEATEMLDLVKQLSMVEEGGAIQILGFYSHNSLSYGASSPDEAMDMLEAEIKVCGQALQQVSTPRKGPLVISVGASPTALSLQNLYASSESSSAKSLKNALQSSTSKFELEIHAGVYPFFDMQQVATSSRESSEDPYDTIAVSVLAEVCSSYPARTEKPEALVSAGCLALAREPCKSYQGWGVVSPWKLDPSYSHHSKDRMIVSRISQEHGILARESDIKEELPLKYGQILRIWPNHACIAMAMFAWYLIVDSDTPDSDEIVDIYARWRGW